MHCGDIVLYCCQGKPCIGKVARKYDVDKWVIVPFVGNRIVLRKTSYMRPLHDFQKYLDIDKKV